MSSLQVYLMAIGANLTFSTASMFFSIYSTRFNPVWMGTVKVTFAMLAFIIAMLLSGQMNSVPLSALALLFFSGLGGLCGGDIFLFKAFTTLGAGRTLVMFSFEPLMLGLYGYFFLNQVFSVNQILAVMCMVVCIYIFMLERSKQTGSWDFKSFVWAFTGITLDAVGVMMTRSAFEISPGLETFQVNVIRCAGALVGFLIISPKIFVQFPKDIWNFNLRDKVTIVGASVGGCFISLALYLAALKYAHVGTLTAISITGPVWVALLESIYFKRWPNRYLVGAFIFFLMGFYLMVIA
ncbi:MAG: DMT family transporter [Bdellovibrionota bacterium]